MKEVEAYKLFEGSEGIIHSVDYSIASERSDPSSKTVYVLLPYYRRGNLQDIINANLVNHTSFPEKKLMLLFLGVCKALKSMHEFHARGAAVERMEVPSDGAGESAHAAKRGKNRRETGADEDDETEQQRPLMAEDNAAAAGAAKSYAHRDIKPGWFPSLFPFLVLPFSLGLFSLTLLPFLNQKPLC